MRNFVRPLLSLVLLAACAEQKAPPPPPVPVTVAVAERRTVPFELPATGTVEPIQTVAVQAQVSGPLQRVAPMIDINAPHHDDRQGDRSDAGLIGPRRAGADQRADRGGDRLVGHDLLATAVAGRPNPGRAGTS